MSAVKGKQYNYNIPVSAYIPTRLDARTWLWFSVNFLICIRQLYILVGQYAKVWVILHLVKCYQINFLFLNEHVDWHSEVLTWIVTCTGDVYLRQLFRDPPEHMVVEIPGLGQVLDVLRSLVLPTPLLGLHQVTTISLWSKTLNEYTNVSLRSNILNEYTNLSLRSNILNVYTHITDDLN